MLKFFKIILCVVVFSSNLAAKSNPEKFIEDLTKFITGKPCDKQAEKKMLFAMLKRRQMRRQIQLNFNFYAKDDNKPEQPTAHSTSERGYLCGEGIPDPVLRQRYQEAMHQRMLEYFKDRPSAHAAPQEPQQNKPERQPTLDQIFETEVRRPVQPTFTNVQFEASIDHFSKAPRTVIIPDEAYYYIILSSFGDAIKHIIKTNDDFSSLLFPHAAFNNLAQRAAANQLSDPASFFAELEKLTVAQVTQLLTARGFPKYAILFLTDFSVHALVQSAQVTAKQYLEMAKDFENFVQVLQQENIAMLDFLQNKNPNAEEILQYTKHIFLRKNFNPKANIHVASTRLVQIIKNSLGVNINSSFAEGSLKNFFSKVIDGGVEFAKRAGLAEIYADSALAFDHQATIHELLKISVLEKIEYEKQAQTNKKESASTEEGSPAKILQPADLKNSEAPNAPPAASGGTPPPMPPTPPGPPKGPNDDKKKSEHIDMETPYKNKKNELFKATNPTAFAMQEGVRLERERAEKELKTKLEQAHETGIEIGLQQAQKTIDAEKTKAAEQAKDKTKLAYKAGAIDTAKKIAPVIKNAQQQNQNLKSENSELKNQNSTKEKTIEYQEKQLQQAREENKTLNKQNQVLAGIASNLTLQQRQEIGLNDADMQALEKHTEKKDVPEKNKPEATKKLNSTTIFISQEMSSVKDSLNKISEQLNRTNAEKILAETDTETQKILLAEANDETRKAIIKSMNNEAEIERIKSESFEKDKKLKEQRDLIKKKDEEIKKKDEKIQKKDKESKEKDTEMEMLESTALSLQEQIKKVCKEINDLKNKKNPKD